MCTIILYKKQVLFAQRVNRYWGWKERYESLVPIIDDLGLIPPYSSLDIDAIEIGAGKVHRLGHLPDLDDYDSWSVFIRN